MTHTHTQSIGFTATELHQGLLIEPSSTDWAEQALVKKEGRGKNSGCGKTFYVENGEEKCLAYGGKGYNYVWWETNAVADMSSIDSIYNTLAYAKAKNLVLIRGVQALDEQIFRRTSLVHKDSNNQLTDPSILSLPRDWMMMDIDEDLWRDALEGVEGMEEGYTEEHAEFVIQHVFKNYTGDLDTVLMWSSSAGMQKDPSKAKIKCHIYFLLSDPLDCNEHKVLYGELDSRKRKKLKGMVGKGSRPLQGDIQFIGYDPACMKSPVQPDYVADPLFLDGVVDPIPGARIFKIRIGAGGALEIGHLMSQIKKEAAGRVTAGTFRQDEVDALYNNREPQTTSQEFAAEFLKKRTEALASRLFNAAPGTSEAALASVAREVSLYDLLKKVGTNHLIEMFIAALRERGNSGHDTYRKARRVVCFALQWGASTIKKNEEEDFRKQFKSLSATNYRCSNFMMQYLNIENPLRTIGLDSLMGTGKTFFISKVIEDNPTKQVVMVSNRRSTVHDTAKRLNMTHYTVSKSDMLMATTVHSLYSIEAICDVKDIILVLDESDTLLKESISLLNKDIVEVFDGLMGWIKNCGLVIFLNAQMQNESFRTIVMSGRDINKDNACVVTNYHQTERFIDLLYTDPTIKGSNSYTKAYAVAMIKEEVIALSEQRIAGTRTRGPLLVSTQGRKHSAVMAGSVACGSMFDGFDGGDLAEAIKDVDLGKTDIRVLVINASTSSLPDQKEWLTSPDEAGVKWDAIICSPSVQTGVSIEVICSHYIFTGGFSHTTPHDLVQQVGRSRDVGCKKVLVIDTTVGYVKPTNADMMFEAIKGANQEQLKELLGSSESVDKWLLGSGRMGCATEEERQHRVKIQFEICRAEARRNAELNDGLHATLECLSREGYVLTGVPLEITAEGMNNVRQSSKEKKAWTAKFVDEKIEKIIGAKEKTRRQHQVAQAKGEQAETEDGYSRLLIREAKGLESADQVVEEDVRMYVEAGAGSGKIFAFARRTHRVMCSDLDFEALDTKLTHNAYRNSRLKTDMLWKNIKLVKAFRKLFRLPEVMEKMGFFCDEFGELSSGGPCEEFDSKEFWASLSEFLISAFDGRFERTIDTQDFRDNTASNFVKKIRKFFGWGFNSRQVRIEKVRVYKSSFNTDDLLKVDSWNTGLRLRLLGQDSATAEGNALLIKALDEELRMASAMKVPKKKCEKRVVISVRGCVGSTQLSLLG